MKIILKIFTLLTLSISLVASDSFEKDLKVLIKKEKERLQAKEIIVSIYDNKSNELLFSNNTKLAKNYIFEPASLMKPLVLSTILKNNKVKKDEVFYAYNEFKFKKDDNKYIKIKNNIDKNGFYPKGEILIDNRWIIRDDRRLKNNYLSLYDILVYSSNIGILQVANRLNGKEFYKALKDFGFGKDIGFMPSLSLFEKKGKDKFNIFKSAVSFGMGIQVTFNQMLNAYIKLNNMNNELINKALEEHFLMDNKNKDLFPNLKISFQTGTSSIIQKKKYTKKYISSIFAFVKNKDKNYTIGITTIEPISKGEFWYYRYAFYSAKPLLFKIIKVLF